MLTLLILSHSQRHGLQEMDVDDDAEQVCQGLILALIVAILAFEALV